MPKEIEAKLKVDSFSQIEKKLESLGARFIAEIVQRDYYFDDAKRDLTKTDRCLRLREEFAANSRRSLLAYKGAREKGRFKKRLEIQTQVSDAESLKALLPAIGYKEKLVYKKRRQLWVYGGCEICLDELPLLGNFVEIEGESEKRIMRVQEELGLSALPHIKESYAALMEREICRLGTKEKEAFLRGQKH